MMSLRRIALDALVSTAGLATIPQAHGALDRADRAHPPIWGQQRARRW